MFETVLNISPVAVTDLQLGNDRLDFEGRFAGIPKRVFVPITAVCGIYAKENGQGMIFDPSISPPEPSGPDDAGPDLPQPEPPEPKKGGIKPPLRLVK